MVVKLGRTVGLSGGCDHAGIAQLGCKNWPLHTKLVTMDTHHLEKGSVAIAFVDEALACIRQRGLDQNELLMKAGISPELLRTPHARISSGRCGELWHLIAQATDDEFFGMDSHRMKVGSFTLLCHAVIQSDCLERALHRATRFLRLVLDDLVGELSRDGESAHIVLLDHQRRCTATPEAQSGARTTASRAFAYSTYMLILHGLACWLVGRRIPISSAAFCCDAPSYTDEWRVLFSQNLSFNQDCCRISFPASYLDLHNTQNERTMKSFLRCAPANFLVKYKNSASVSARIRRRLREWPPASWPDFETLAQQFHTSSATMRRRLDEEGESYRSIMDGLRRDLAISLLGDTRLSIADIAEELGFAESGAFHRAFKKWTGARPGEYRRSF
jgi:AraC-like DNA-binding protein